MVKFKAIRGYTQDVQHALDNWSEQYPDASFDDINIEYSVDDSGHWYVMLVWEE